jgi:hypothetical protein
MASYDFLQDQWIAPIDFLGRNLTLALSPFDCCMIRARLLDERRSRGDGLATNTYQNAPLWKDMVALTTDGLVRPAMRH